MFNARRMTEIELKELFKPLGIMPYQSEIQIAMKKPDEKESLKTRLSR